MAGEKRGESKLSPFVKGWRGTGVEKGQDATDAFFIRFESAELRG